MPEITTDDKIPVQCLPEITTDEKIAVKCLPEITTDDKIPVKCLSETTTDEKNLVKHVSENVTDEKAPVKLMPVSTMLPINEKTSYKINTNGIQKWAFNKQNSSNKPKGSTIKFTICGGQ